jgi:hypothetical protein
VFKGRECNQAAHELAAFWLRSSVAALGLLCDQGEEQIMSSILDSVHVIAANDLIAVE